MHEFRSALMSEFSSGAFKPSESSQFLHHQRFGVRNLEGDRNSYQDVKWGAQDNINMEGSITDHGSFLTRPDSALTLASPPAFATYDLLNNHVVVDDHEIFSQHAGYEPPNNLQYTITQLEELYGGYHGGRWQATADQNETNDIVVVVPMSSEETTKSPGPAYQVPFFNSSSTDSAQFGPPKLSQSNRLSAPVMSTVATPAGRTYRATTCRTSARHPTLESKRLQGRGRGRGESRTVSRMDRSITLGLGTQPMTVNYHSALKVARAPSEYAVGKRQLHSARMTTDQLEHVQRERQRRDDMSAKIATLETLLPPSSKRDRVSIVHDGIHYVKALQQKLKALQDKLQEAKRISAGVKERKWSLTGNSSNFDFASGNKNLSNVQAAMQVARLSQSSHPTYKSGTVSDDGGFEGWGLPPTILHQTPKSEPLQKSSTISVELHVQVDRPGEQVQVVKCECRYSYLSSMLRTLDQLQLILHRCSVTKVHDYVICIIVIKPTTNCSKAHAVSSAQIATLLQIAAGES